MKFYNFGTKKVYESDGKFTVSVQETPLRDDVSAKEYEDEEFYSYDEALEYINSVLAPKILGDEGFEEGDYDVVDDGMVVTVTVPNYKEWKFILNGDNLIECMEAKANGKSLNEWVLGKTDFKSGYSEFERYASTRIPEFELVFRQFYWLALYGTRIADLISELKKSGADRVSDNNELFKGLELKTLEWFNSKLNRFVGLIYNKVMDANNPDEDYKINLNDLVSLIPDLDAIAGAGWGDAPKGIDALVKAAKDASEQIKIVKAEAEKKATEQPASSNESVASRFAKYRAMFESDDEDSSEGDDKDDKGSESEGSSEDGSEGDDKGEEGSEGEGDDKGDKEDGDDEAEMTAIVLTVAHGDGEKLKKEMLEAKDDNDEEYGFDEDNIEVIEGEDDEDDKVKIDASEAFNLKKFLADKKDIDLEDEIGGEIVDDSEDGEGEGDDKGEDGEGSEGDGEGEDSEDSFDFNDLGDLFGADEE